MMKRSVWLLVAIAAAVFPSIGLAAGQPVFDVVIEKGRVMDPESELDAVRNIGIRGDKIAAITSDALAGRIVLNARGLVVAPGFIDLHQHSQDPQNDIIKASDGVTTALELEVGTADIDAFYKAQEGKRLINYGASIGHIRVRMAVMHDPSKGLLPSGDAVHKAASPAELQKIQAAIEKGLQRGAPAVGAGPAYTPAASNLEILNVFEIAAKHKASVHVHIRTNGEPDGTFPGFQEVLADAAATGAALHVVHIHSTGGANVLHELDMIRGAKARGLDITTEVYPYDQAQTLIESAVFDNWEKFPDSVITTGIWPKTGEHLTRESFARFRKIGGIVIFPIPGLTPELVRAVIADPLTMIASDGHFEDGTGHPREAGTFARVLGQYVREEHALSLMDAVRKMTLMPARRLEPRVAAMRNKGRLRVGADADVTVFDPARVRDAATYAQPALRSVGIRYVVVNGVVVIKDGVLQSNSRAGRPVRAPIE